jgi:hypothetical protein
VAAGLHGPLHRPAQAAGNRLMGAYDPPRTGSP